MAQISINVFAFCLVAIGPFLAEIKQIPYLTLKIQGQGHDENRPKSNQVIYRSGPIIVPKMKEIQKDVQKLSRGQSLRPAAAHEPVQKHKVTPGIPGWLNKQDFENKLNLTCQAQSTPKTIGILTKVFCTSGPNLVVLAWTGDELSHRQAQNGVNFDSEVKFDLVGQVNHPQKQ